MEKYLFGAIGALLLCITGIGLCAVSQHPEETVQIPSTALQAVSEASRQATSAITGTETSGASTQSQTASVETAGADNDSDDGGEDSDDDARTPQTQLPQSMKVAQTPGTYTLAQVAKHNSASSCYTAINGGVYDLTKWINMHPGGQAAILSLCGMDGTQAFEDQHGGQRRPENELASLKIGTLLK